MDIIKQIDTFFFRIINSSGWYEFDFVMILISSKWLWIPLYLYILFNIYKKFPDNFYKICFALTLLIFIPFVIVGSRLKPSGLVIDMSKFIFIIALTNELGTA